MTALTLFDNDPVVTRVIDEFEQWWTVFPKRVGKGTAKRAWQIVIHKKIATPRQLIEGAMRYAAERDGKDPQFTKHPATWINSHGWLDESAASSSRGSLFEVISELER